MLEAITSRERVMAEIKQMIAKLIESDQDPIAIPDNSQLVSLGTDAPTLGLDSVDVLELLMQLKRRYAIAFPPNFDISKYLTVERLADYVCQQVGRHS